jgi:hypothetical protein
VATGTLHEDLKREERTAGPSDRKFGLTMGAILALMAIWKSIHWSIWGSVCAVPAAALIGCALLRPGLLSPLNDIWLRFGLLLHRIVSPVIMALLFYGTIVPIGLMMRTLGKDPLRLKLDKTAGSYWLPRSDDRLPSESMREQF